MATERPVFYERIVCLANSRKKSGRCIAGKRITNKTWCRVISGRPSHEISPPELRYSSGKLADIFDVIEIPCLEKSPSGHQQENVLIDTNFMWRKIRRSSWNEIYYLVDRNADLWEDGHSSYYNLNNRVPEKTLDTQSGSLRLVELDELIIECCQKAPEFGENHLSVKGLFNYSGAQYRLDITDPLVEYDIKKRGEGKYTCSNPLVCISLSDIYNNYAYKLIASIISKQQF